MQEADLYTTKKPMNSSLKNLIYHHFLVDIRLKNSKIDGESKPISIRYLFLNLNSQEYIFFLYFDLTFVE